MQLIRLLEMWQCPSGTSVKLKVKLKRHQLGTDVRDTGVPNTAVLDTCAAYRCET
jgi:hypothetical protein